MRGPCVFVCFELMGWKMGTILGANGSRGAAPKKVKGQELLATDWNIGHY